MTLKDIPKNRMLISMALLEEGSLEVLVGHNLDEENMDPDTLDFLEDLLNGIRVKLGTSMDDLSAMGRMARIIQDLRDELEETEHVTFEPAEELLRSIEGDAAENVVPLFNKGKLH
jgi:hypothetical protein